MSATASQAGAPVAPDLIDELAKLDPAQGVGALRRQRPAAVEAIEGSRNALFAPEACAIPVAERAAVAAHVADLEEEKALAEHYRAIIASAYGADDAKASARLDAMLAHAEFLVRDPIAAEPARLAALAEAGLSPRDIVVLSQLVAFVTYETRLLAGLRLLGA